MSIGTPARPIESSEAMKIARALLSARFSGPNDKRGLWYFRGWFWEWYGGQWRRRDLTHIEDAVWIALEDSHYMGADGGIRRVKPNRALVENVVRALSALTRSPRDQLPVWLGGGRPTEEGLSVGFLDVVVTVEGGSVRTVPRTEDWLDTCVVPAEYDPGAGCPRWMQCLDEWSGGDPAWKSLLQRWMGYCLLPTRKYARWLLKYGKIRGGKGTIDQVLALLVGPEAFKGTSLDDITERFGLWGLETARVLSISEVSDLEGHRGEKASRIIKNILGQDRITVDVKMREPLHNVVMAAAPMVSSNEIPSLPNKGMGMSGKMLVLPFEHSFLGREDWELLDKLWRELPGIAAWALEGARQLEAEGDPSKKWPVPAQAQETVRMFHLHNNYIDAFLEARFVPVEVGSDDPAARGFVPTGLILREFDQWRKATQVQVHVPRNQLIGKILQESTWDLRRYRIHEGPKGLKGLQLRKVAQDV